MIKLRFACWLLLVMPGLLAAQSTFGTIVGTVTDPSGAVIPSAKVTITNLAENTSVTVYTNNQGMYEAPNLKAANYKVTIEAAGFKSFVAGLVPLAARQVVRVNAVLEVGTVSESIRVEAMAPLITTDTQTIISSLDTRAVLELPVNYRGAGSTSPYRVLAFLPGVQSDDSFNFSVQGAVPAQVEYTVDGISSVNVTGHAPLPEVYPSAESIAEMKVQGVGGNAEFGQIGDVTTTSRGGGNQYHGSLFEYLQNRALDANPYGATSKPPKVANTFGGSLGGRLVRDRTFFFTTYEEMQYRRWSALQATVPTEAMRAGDFSRENVTLRDPFTGSPLPGNRIPGSQIVGVAKKVLEFYPLPNFGPTDVQRSANFRKNESSPITSRQFDVRVDHILTGKQSVFGRVSWKNISTTSPTWQLLPADTTAVHARNLVFSHNYAIAPNLLNEARFGLTINDDAVSFHFDGWKITGEMGLQGLPDLPYNGLPGFSFSQGTSGFGKSKPDFHNSHLYQWNDNLTWIRGRHTLKFGGDVRRIRAQSALSFGLNHGQFIFDGRFSRHDVADFLMGLPYQSRYADSRINNDGRTAHYAVFAQDSFKVTSRLTLEYGLRWEYHPAYKDANGNITNFDRNVPRTGRVIIPSGARAREITYPGFLLSINACPAPDWNGIPCTPFLQANEVGWPDSLRFAIKKDFAPRFGFAWRPFDNTKTAIRGGVGRYFMVPLGSFYYGLTAIHASGVREFTNSITAGAPAFRLPQVSPGGGGIRVTSYGNAYFGTAEDPYYPDPFAVQWHLTVERELGWDAGLRLSYIGMRFIQQPWAPDLNQPLPSTVPYTQRPLTDRPFPYWGRVYSYDAGANAIYNAAQTEIRRRFRGGLNFNSAWTWAKHLSDNGVAPSGWGNEMGNGRVTDSLNRRSSRGNVAPTRRHRWITNAIYELPFGKGRRYMNHAHPILQGVAGGWRISSILLLQTGPYLTAVFTGGDPSGTNAPARGSQRPDALRSGNLDNPTPDRWWDREAFICPGRLPGAPDRFNCNVTPIGRFGNGGVGTLVGPSTINLSMGIGKQFPIREWGTLKFEASFTNLPNHRNLANPGNNITSISFGQT
ncbi:MAG: TonB-dependent receptor domain-containing protein, partial [Bryobacteraceae bacterium]